MIYGNVLSVNVVIPVKSLSPHTKNCLSLVIVLVLAALLAAMVPNPIITWSPVFWLWLCFCSNPENTSLPIPAILLLKLVAVVVFQKIVVLSLAI